MEEAVYLRCFRMNETELYSMPQKDHNVLRSRHDWLETESAGNGFEDDERRVARFSDNLEPDRTVTLTAPGPRRREV